MKGMQLPWLARFTQSRWGRRLVWLSLAAMLLVLVVGFLGWQRLRDDRPVVYADIEAHFKYGSTGGERESGFPYWIFQALPQICAEHLPGDGYASLGLMFEAGRDLPVGMSKRSFQGLDRTFLNCAVCHTSTVRDSPGSEPRLYLGMPANTFNILAFQQFFFACGKDPKFRKDYIVPAVAALMKAEGKKLGVVDRYLVYPLAVWLMRERLLMLAGRFEWANTQHPWGPGRVDTFNAAKVLFNFPMHQLPEQELNGPSDFPSIWNQAPRKGMQLHWDGNNTLVEERNKSAAFGTGTTPPTLDRKAIGRVEDWLLTLAPPAYPYPIDTAKAARGAPLYAQYCAACHGAGPRDVSGPLVGKVTPWEEVRTDRRRLDTYTYDLAVNQATLYAGYDWRFQHFRKTFGYANAPLDGIWLRGPYLHNGSVPNLYELLEPSARRSPVFYRGYDVYDPVRVGFKADIETDSGKSFFKYDVTVPGNSNVGHEGERYGTELEPEEKDALLEYLKTL
jgi:cytochrome c2